VNRKADELDEIRELTMDEFIRSCGKVGVVVARNPNFQQTATALHDLVRATRCSTRVTDAPSRGNPGSSEPMTVFAARSRVSSGKPARWPSKDLQAVRRQESQIKRARKPSKVNLDLIRANQRRDLPQTDPALDLSDDRQTDHSGDNGDRPVG
jgi:hypothetical protein